MLAAECLSPRDTASVFLRNSQDRKEPAAHSGPFSSTSDFALRTALLVCFKFLKKL